ncbi:MAG: hypothetical protein H7282_13370, partial [Cytophagaceae bacterium]|nr:hypothetical protein [Cytophagaceae bacterium]
MKIFTYTLFLFVSLISTAFATAPSSASSGLNYTNITASQMTLNWTSGNGTTRVVVANQGSAVSFTPTDGVDYASYQSLGSGQVIVYKGAASGFNFTTMGSTNLVANTTYYFTIYEYNGTGVGTQYLVSPNLTGSQNTSPIASKPTTPVTSATIIPFQGTFNSQPQQRIGMSWAGQSGLRTMIIMRAGSSVDPTVLPADGSKSFQWQALANSQVVCYYGTGTSYTLKSDGYGNLTPGTTYYFLFATLNGDGSTSSYLTSSYYATSSKTLTNAPTVNASNLTFSNIQTNQMTLNWTNGNGANRIIVAKQGSAVTFVPSNGISYALNSSLGSGEYIVYNGSGSTYTLSSGSTPLGTITSSTNYYFAIYEYNGSGTGCNYYTPALSGNQLTSANASKPTIASSSLVFSNVQTSQMTLTWTKGNGSGRIVVMRKSAAVSAAPVDGTTYSNYQSLGSGNTIMYNGSGNTFTFSNDGYGPLTSNTTYYFAIYEYNGSGSTINYLTSSFLSGNQTTAGAVAEPTTASSALSFTNVHSYQMTLNWTSGNGSG